MAILLLENSWLLASPNMESGPEFTLSAKKCAS